MKDYFSVNKFKFLFQVIINSCLLSIGWTAYLMTRSQPVNINTIITGYILTVLILPLLTQTLIVGKEIIEFKRISKVLNNDPFDQLTTIGFSKTFTDRKSRWLPSRPMLSGKIDNYCVIIEVKDGTLKIIANADLDLVQKTHMTELRSIFGKNNIQYDVGIALLYKPSRRKNLSFHDLNSELRQFIYFLKSNGLTPWKESNNG